LEQQKSRTLHIIHIYLFIHPIMCDLVCPAHWRVVPLMRRITTARIEGKQSGIEWPETPQCMLWQPMRYVAHIHSMLAHINLILVHNRLILTTMYLMRNTYMFYIEQICLNN
jgi:hypothetical protein